MITKISIETHNGDLRAKVSTRVWGTKRVLYARGEETVQGSVKGWIEDSYFVSDQDEIIELIAEFRNQK